MEQVSIELMISGLLAALKQRHITETAKKLIQAKFISTYGPKRLIKQCILIIDCHCRLLLVTSLIKSFFKIFQTIPISKPFLMSLFSSY